MRQLPGRDGGVRGVAPADGFGAGFDAVVADDLDDLDGLRRPRPRPQRPGDLRAHVVGVVQAMGVGRLVGGAMAALVAVAVGWWLLRPPPVPLEDTLPMITLSSVPTGPSANGGGSDASVTGAGEAGSADGGSTGSSGEVLVHVAGAVRRPGVYRLSSDARVADAVDRAGGASRRADLDGVNLAAPVSDGQQILVPRRGEVMTATADDSSSQPTGPVDLNRADVLALDALPGIGPATAAAIIAHRDEHGPFVTVDDLLDVPGIGPAKLSALRDLVTT